MHCMERLLVAHPPSFDSNHYVCVFPPRFTHLKYERATMRIDWTVGCLCSDQVMVATHHTSAQQLLACGWACNHCKCLKIMWLIVRRLHCNVLKFRTWITALNSQMTVLGAQSALCCMLSLLAIVLMYTNSAYHSTVAFDWINVNAKVICERGQILENFVIMFVYCIMQFSTAGYMGIILSKVISDFAHWTDTRNIVGTY